MNKIQAIVEATLHTKPKGRTHWSCRLMAASQGVSKSTINTIWRRHQLKPHQTKRFKLSRDPRFLERLTDVVGLYLNPPQEALVLCVDEKSQIQALARTQPGLPLKTGRCGTMTLFAALEVLRGRVVGQCYQRHRHQEFVKFLRRLDQAFPGDTPLHVVMDNDGTHTHPKVQAWLTRHPPLPSALRADQCQLAQFDRALVRRTDIQTGAPWVLRECGRLQDAITEFLAVWNEKPRPFVWTATVESIQQRLARCRQTLEQVQPGSTEPRPRKKNKQLSS